MQDARNVNGKTLRHCSMHAGIHTYWIGRAFAFSVVKVFWGLGALWVLLLCSACSGPGQRAIEGVAETAGFRSEIIQGEDFAHQVLFNFPAGADVDRLHVYMEGDGTPWLGKGRPAMDPTSRRPVALKLMVRDSTPAIHLGRPCYGRARESNNCHPWIWTHGRYGKDIVDSMLAALNRAIGQRKDVQLVLIGHSGGGALAMLMAGRRAGVTDLVTLAGNLDVASWAAHHGYSPLKGSLDPALQPPLPSRIRQWHWAGDEDQQVPPKIVEQSLKRRHGAKLRILRGLDHSCCWEREWPEMLRFIRQTQDSRLKMQGTATSKPKKIT